MGKEVSVLIVEEGELCDDLVDSLGQNQDFVKEVIFSGTERKETERLKELDVSVNFLGITEGNKPLKKNRLVDEATGDYLLFLNSSCVLEDSTVEELLETMEETKVDIVYPNVVIRFSDGEKVKNYQDLYGHEMDLVKSLAVEEYLPEWGVLVRKESFNKFGGFNEDFADFEFYEFIYRNLRNLKLKLSKFSYIEYSVFNSFIDTSYRSYVLRTLVLKNFDWKKEIFPFLSWEEKPEIAKATAFTLIGNRLVSYFDYFNASQFYREALLIFHNQETLKELIKTYLNMGLFDYAKELISDEQGVSKKDQEELSFYIDKILNIVDELEKAIKDGKVVETLAAIQEVVQIYSGAPIYNILGVIKWIEKKFEEAYKFFYKAVTMNPINKDYLYNLTELAKFLRREEEVKGLIDRLVGS